MEPTLVDLLVSGGHLLTMDGEAPEIADGAIAFNRYKPTAGAPAVQTEAAPAPAAETHHDDEPPF